MKLLNLYVCALSLPFLCGACGGGKEEWPEVVPVKVKTMRVAPVALETTERFSGTVEEGNGTPLSFSVGGTVAAVHVGVGRAVAKGELIAVLDSVSMLSSYMAARAMLDQAEDAYRRMSELHDKGSLAEIKWTEAQSKLQQARSMERMARKNLDDCRLYAPCGGVIAEKNLEVGQNVIPGVSVARLVTTDVLKVKIAVPEAEMSEVAVGQEAEIAVPALGDRRWTGEVVEKGVVASPLSRAYSVKVQIGGADAGLMPGMVAEVRLKRRESETAVIIPARLLRLDEQNRSFVWVSKDGRAEKRIVRCGKFTADGVAVLSGLKQGEMLVVEGQQKLSNEVELQDSGS